MEPESKSCWECLRRRLVCDGTRPTCNKCSTNDIVCPGFGNTKPLKWLAPGRVTSRTRRPTSKKRAKPGKSTAKAVPAKEPEEALPSDEVSLAGSSHSSATLWFSNSEVESGSVGTNVSGVVSDAGVSQDGSEGSEGAVVKSRRGGRMKIPTHMEFRTHSSDVIQAVYYFNNVVYPLQVSLTLGPSPFIQPISPEHVHLIPSPISHLILSMALNARIFHLARAQSRTGLPELRSRLQGARVEAIQCLNGEIRKVSSFSGNLVIVSVLVFLYVELEQCEAHDTWKCHMDGFSTLVNMRGGISELARGPEYMRLIIVCFTIVQICANATSPPGSQIDIALTDELLSFMAEHYESANFPSLPCPLELFLIMIQINSIRTQSNALMPTDSASSSTPDLLLIQLQLFSPEQWALTKPDKQVQWLLIARIYQSALILYLLSALAPFLEHYPGATQENHTLRVLHTSRLFLLLEQAEQTPAVLWGCAFPLTVAGVEAKREGGWARDFMRRRLEQMAREQALCLPKVALRVFEEFWASGREGWDGCFVRPCAFVI